MANRKRNICPRTYQRICLDVEEKKARVIFEMKEVNRQVVMRVLDKIEKDGTKKISALLRSMENVGSEKSCGKNYRG